MLSGLLLNWTLLIPAAFAAPAASYSVPGHNTFQQFLREGHPSKASHGPFVRPSNPRGALTPQANTKTGKPLPSAEPATMRDQTYLLDDSFVLHRPAMKPSAQPATVQGTVIPAGSTPLIFRGSDGRLEIDLPRGSLDFAHASLAQGLVPVGQLFLQIHQMAGHSIEADSILGTYRIQIVDSLGHVVQGVVLTHPVTIVYHYQQEEMRELDLDPTQIALAWPDLLATARASGQSEAGLVLPMTNNAPAHTLSAQTTVLGGVLTASGTPEIAAPTTPDLTAASGNSGQYSYSYPFALVPGPDGFTPQLHLVYSSQSTNQRYSRRAPAGDEGEGFSLSLGSITAAQYPSGSAGGAATWYSLNGVDGVSDRLVPIPTKSGYYETEHLSHLLIQFTGTCWYVWGKEGSYFRLGCTTDSRQKTASGTYEWDLNEVLAPYNDPHQVKTMLISYLQDSPDGGTTIRDAGIKQIQYGYATTINATSLSLVAGTIDFHYHLPSVPSGQSAFATAYGTNYNCASSPPSSTTLRCDDPTQYGTIAPPSVMSTMTLDSITSYVGSDSANHPAYRYTFTYQDQPFTTDYYDSYSLTRKSAAGEHLLTQITPSVYLAGIAHTRPSVVFGYSGPLRDGYTDPNEFVQNSTTTHYGGQTYWNYLTFYEDLATGEGARISYANAHGNMTGTPYVTDASGNVIDDRFDPLYCATQANNPDTSKRCSGTPYGQPDTDSWGLQVVTQISALGTDSSGNPTVATTSYHYTLTQVPASSLPAGCNPITGTGVPAQEAACVADTWSPSAGSTHDGDWLDYYHTEFRGFNTVYITSPSGDLTVENYVTTEGWWTSPSDGVNANSGQLYQQDVYQGNSPTPGALLRETVNYYAGASVPAGNPYPSTGCETAASPVYPPCVGTPLETKTTFFEGGSASNAPWIDTKYTYDDQNASGGYVSGGYHNLLQEVISGSNLNSSVYPLTKKWTYAITDSEGSPTYYTVNKVSHSEIDDSSGHVWACQDTTYDEGRPGGVPTPDAGLATTVKSYSTCGTASTALTSYTAYDQYGNAVATVDALGAANPGLYSSHGCTATGVVDLAASWTAGHFTTCTTYDTTQTADLPTGQINALGQTTSLAYDSTSAVQLTSSTDANSQTTGYSSSYDSSGNETISVKAPGESGAFTTQQSEHSSCTTSSTLPCYEIDATSALYPNAISRTFYDAQGRAIETRTPGPTSGDDTIVATVYNDQNHTKWQSVPFQVASGSGWLDPNGATDIAGHAPAGTTTFYDALGRVVATQDPNYGSAQEPGQSCAWGLSGTYTACINYTTTGGSSSMDEETDIDANGHVIQKQMDALGQVIYVNTYSGPQQNIIEQQTETLYNALGKPYYIETDDDHIQGGQTIDTIYTHLSYDDQGRLLTLIDHDQGTFTYTYDPDGHVLAVVQTSISGSSNRTLGYNYDLLGRLGCEQTAAPTINWNGACSAGSPLLQNTYDTTFLGIMGSTDFPVGRLTQSVATTSFPDGTSASVTQQVQTDARGRTVAAQMQLGLPAAWNVTSALPAYQMAQSYNDANQPTTTTLTAVGASYSFTQVYDSSNGVLQGLSNTPSSTANLASLTYNEYAQPGSLTLLNGAASSPASIASETFNDDADLRPLSLSATWLPGSGNSGQILSNSRTYDLAGNVTSVATTMAAVPGQSGSGGSETQNFCYDEQNRLVWAGNAGTQPGSGSGTCGSGTLSTSFSSGSYTTGYVYTNLGEIWQGPLGGQGAAEQYLYCNSSASGPHELSGVYPIGTTCANKGSASALYSAGYDGWGNQTSRTYNGVTATLSYDALNRLVNWQSASGASEQTVYDASGERVLTRSTNLGTTTLTVYAFGLQELFYTGTGTLTSQTGYYSLAGHLVGSTNGSVTTYYLTDAEGSLLTSLSASAITGEQLYAPYGTTRYTVGSLGTAKAFTGQEADPLTGLYYYHARWYDPVVGLFVSVDTKEGNAQGVNPYGYVRENPETWTDPTGEYRCGDPNNCNPSPYKCGPCTAPPGWKPPDGTLKSLGCSSGMSPSGKTCVYDSGQCKGLTEIQCSNAKKAWKSDSNKVREEKLSGLKTQAFWELLAGYLLFAIADLMTIFDKLASKFDRLGAIIDLFATIGNSIIPLIGGAIGGEIAVWASRVSAFIMGGLGLAQAALAWVKSGDWWKQAGVNTVMNILTSGIGGPITIMVQVLMVVVKPIIGNLLDMGGHFLQAAGLADEAEITRQENMPIEDWCAQYGGCPSFSSYVG